MATVEVIAIGNELLRGDVQDTNTHWLCRNLTGLGADVRRGALVADDIDAIAAEVRAALGRRTDLVLTAGGLGPTPDDMTLAAVARTSEADLALDEGALQMVSATYREYAAAGYVTSPDMTPAREKMAWLPRGATPLANPVGAAPGVLLEVGSSVLVCLPGVPDELRGIFSTSLQPTLQRLLGSSAFVQEAIIADIGDESALAPIIARVAADHPAVQVKSWPKRFGPHVRIRVTLSARGQSHDEAAAKAASALSSLSQTLEALGIDVADGC